MHHWIHPHDHLSHHSKTCTHQTWSPDTRFKNLHTSNMITCYIGQQITQHTIQKLAYIKHDHLKHHSKTRTRQTWSPATSVNRSPNTWFKNLHTSNWSPDTSVKNLHQTSMSILDLDRCVSGVELCASGSSIRETLLPRSNTYNPSLICSSALGHQNCLNLSKVEIIWSAR